jgi:Ca-activated chloride channel family protein
MIWLIPILTFAIAATGEWLHGRRARRLGRLAFGPAGRPRAWTQAMPALRVLCLAGIAWSLCILYTLKPKTFDQNELPALPQDCRRVVFLLDVSPSMRLNDAGEDGKMKRCSRGADVVDSILDRVVSNQCLFSVVAFYTSALPVTVDCRDPEIIRHIISELPLDCAFEYGKTDLAEGLTKTFAICKDWPAGSTTVFVITDGDTVPDKGLQRAPPAINRVVLVGVGNPSSGVFIDGHQSRQDARSLTQVARRVSGDYFNGNNRQLPTALMNDLDKSRDKSWLNGASLRELALAVLATAAALLALIPILLERFGSDWLRQRPRTN